MVRLFFCACIFSVFVSIPKLQFLFWLRVSSPGFYFTVRLPHKNIPDECSKICGVRRKSKNNDIKLQFTETTKCNLPNPPPPSNPLILPQATVLLHYIINWEKSGKKVHCCAMLQLLNPQRKNNKVRVKLHVCNKSLDFFLPNKRCDSDWQCVGFESVQTEEKYLQRRSLTQAQRAKGHWITSFNH